MSFLLFLTFVNKVAVHEQNKAMPTALLSPSIKFNIITAMLAIIPMIEKIIPISVPLSFLLFFIEYAPLSISNFSLFFNHLLALWTRSILRSKEHGQFRFVGMFIMISVDYNSQ